MTPACIKRLHTEKNSKVTRKSLYRVYKKSRPFQIQISYNLLQYRISLSILSMSRKPCAFTQLQQ